MTSVNSLGFDKDSGRTRVVVAISGEVDSSVAAAKNAPLVGFHAVVLRYSFTASVLVVHIRTLSKKHANLSASNS